MDRKLIYSDRLVSITENAITFRRYYYPTRKDKVVLLANIESIVVRALTIWNGKWRLHGTGSIKTWYPEDMNRPQRDRIFFAVLKNQWVNIGFTVENADRVEEFFRKQHLIKA
ncbi:MAG: hypothetical protein HY881_18875 [Deltaproteobacteria bacterium]|nr:hypothetical protein [Deltaproteobacteria bacterium]